MRPRWPLVLFLSILVMAAACGDEPGETASPSTSSTTRSTVSSTTTSTAAATGTTATTAPATGTTVRVYFLRDEKVGPTARPVTGPATAAGAIDALLAGPNDEERKLGFGSAIPAGTARLGIKIENRIATVDLSPEFSSGGGSASMQGRVAQVVFTLTQFPTVDAVRFQIAGRPVSALGGEGLLLEQPQRRADWEDLTPAILVESPLPWAEVASPLRVRGTANTFEATFQIRLADADGRTLYDRYAMATSGTGTRGTFDVTVTFDAPRAGTGRLTVFESSAKDGSPINVVEIPVRL